VKATGTFSPQNPRGKPSFYLGLVARQIACVLVVKLPVMFMFGILPWPITLSAGSIGTSLAI
jgi:hypothetical protein